jgi:hypothetical protein
MNSKNVKPQETEYNFRLCQMIGMDAFIMGNQFNITTLATRHSIISFLNTKTCSRVPA